MTAVSSLVSQYASKLLETNRECFSKCFLWCIAFSELFGHVKIQRGIPLVWLVGMGESWYLQHWIERSLFAQHYLICGCNWWLNVFVSAIANRQLDSKSAAINHSYCLMLPLMKSSAVSFKFPVICTLQCDDLFNSSFHRPPTTLTLPLTLLHLQTIVYSSKSLSTV